MRYKATNKNGEYGMTGVFEEIKDDLRREVNQLNQDSMHISLALFTRIVNLYFQEIFKQVIDGAVFSLHNRLGHLIVIKSLCIRYNPTKVYFVTENGEKVRKTKNIELVNGRWAHLFWDVGKKWRMYKFIPATKFKIQIAENFLNGKDYPEMDLKSYGRNASSTYIQYLK